MAKKRKLKRKIKLTKNQQAWAWAIGIPLVVGLLSLLVGIVGTRYVESRKRPGNIVWAADKAVTVPSDLRSFLLTQDRCKSYRGEGSPTGVGLWGIFQVSHGKFAKLAYGCSWDLNNYMMAVKEKGKWKLLEPARYFAPFQNTTSTGALPLCSVVDQYKIDKSIESFCIDPAGVAKANTNQ